MSEKKTVKFSGMLNQHEFKERYAFTVQRINTGLTRGDMAFLLGKTSYHVTDYEALSEHIKMDYKDHEVMASLFERKAPEPLNFNTKRDQYDISFEKRIVRGFYVESINECYYQYTHPWTIKGVNKPITIYSSIKRDGNYDEEIASIISVQLNNMINIGYLDIKNSPIMLYQGIKKHIASAWHSSIPYLLKKVVYEFIYSGQLIIKKEHAYIYFQKNYKSNPAHT